MKYINVITTALTLFICLYAFYHLKKNECKDTVYMALAVRKEKFIFVCLFMLALLLRIFMLGKIPGAVNQDSAMATLDAESLMKYGHDLDGIYMPVHLNAWGDSQMSALMTYCMIPFLKLFGFNKISAVMPTLIFSMLGIVAGYFLVRRMFGAELAVIFMMVCVCNPWHFVQSRWPLDCNLMPHFWIIALLLLYIGIEAGSNRWIYLSMIVWGLSHYNYGITVYTVPVFLLILYIICIRRKLLKWTQMIWSVVIYLVVSAPFYLMILINTFKMPSIVTPFFTIPYFEGSQRSKDIIFFSDQPLRQLIENLHSFINVLFLQKDEILWSNVPHFGTLYLCFVPLLILGMVVAFRKTRRIQADSIERLKYDVLWIWALISLADGMITRDVNSNRMCFAFYCAIIFISIGIYAVVKSGKYSACVMFTIMAVMSIIFTYDYFTEYADKFYDAEYAFTGNFELALEKAESIKADRYCITSDSQYTGSRSVSETDTKYVWELDSMYCNGEKSEEQVLPYKDRFEYVAAHDLAEIDEKNNMVYVVNSEDAKLFDTSAFNVYDYKQFYVMAPKWLDANTQ